MGILVRPNGIQDTVSAAFQERIFFIVLDLQVKGKGSRPRRGGEGKKKKVKKSRERDQSERGKNEEDSTNTRPFVPCRVKKMEEGKGEKKEKANNKREANPQ